MQRGTLQCFPRRWTNVVSHGYPSNLNLQRGPSQGGSGWNTKVIVCRFPLSDLCFESSSQLDRSRAQMTTLQAVCHLISLFPKAKLQDCRRGHRRFDRAALVLISSGAAYLYTLLLLLQVPTPESFGTDPPLCLNTQAALPCSYGGPAPYLQAHGKLSQRPTQSQRQLAMT